MAEVSERTLRRWAEALAGIAKTGLGFTESQYEQERFEEVLRIAADIRVAADDEAGVPLDADGLVAEWLGEIDKGVAGYVTPKVAVGAAVSNDDGRAAPDPARGLGRVALPDGVVRRRVLGCRGRAPRRSLEETGIEVEPVRLIGVLDGLRLGMSRIPLYSLLFHCRAVGGELEAHPLECTDVGWFTESTLPTPLVGYERWGEPVFAALRGEVRDVYYDTMRRPVWRGEP